MGIEWGKRKLFISNDEENSAVGLSIGFSPFVFSFWTKKHAVDFVEEPIYTEEDSDEYEEYRKAALEELARNRNEGD